MTTDTDVLRRFRPRTATFCMVMLVAALTACAGQADPPLGSTLPPGQPVLPIGTVSPQYGELPIDRTTDAAPTVPWQLVRVDRQKNRTYLSASTAACSHRTQSESPIPPRPSRSRSPAQAAVMRAACSTSP